MTKPNVHAVHRDWDRDFPVIVRTEGIYLFDEHGRRYIDGSGGSSVVTSIGHGVAEIPEAMYEQAQKFSFYPAHAFTNQAFLDLSDLIVSLAPGELRDNSRVWVTCTGTDATDDAVRLARQYWVEAGQPGKYQVISRWQAFHGNNIAVAGFSGLTARRKVFQPMYVDSPHIPPAFCYRCYFEKTYPECDLLCARALGDRHSPAGSGERRRLHRRAGGGRCAGLRARPGRLLPGDPGDLRPLRRTLHRRRSDDRLGTDRQRCGASITGE